MNSFKNHLKRREKFILPFVLFSRIKKINKKRGGGHTPNQNHLVERVGVFKRKNGNSNKLLVELVGVPFHESQ